MEYCDYPEQLYLYKFMLIQVLQVLLNPQNENHIGD